MNSVFWIGAVVGAVFGVIADLFARPMQRFLDRRVEDRTTVRAKLLTERLQQDRAAIRDFLVLQILETTFIGAFVGIIAGVIFGASSAAFGFGSLSELGSILTIVGQAVSLIGGVLIVRIAADAIRVGRRVLDYADVSRERGRRLPGTDST